MSRNAVVIDIETTGDDPAEDRICSLGLIALVDGQVHHEGQLYLLFDPGRDSSAEAQARHGLDPWLLSHQRPFSHYAARLRALLERAPLVVGHEIARKMNFLNREFERAGLAPIRPHGFCTRDAAARRWPRESPSLQACLSRLGIQRPARKHGVSEDCALTAALYLFFQGNMKPDIRYPAKPQNLRQPPPKPESQVQQADSGN